MRPLAVLVLLGTIGGPAWGQGVDLVLPDTTMRVSSAHQVKLLLAQRLARDGSQGRLGSVYRVRSLDWEAASAPRLKVRLALVGTDVPPPDTTVARDGEGVPVPQLAAFLQAAHPGLHGYLFSGGRPAWQVDEKRFFRHGSGYGVLYHMAEVAQQTLQVMAAYEQPHGGAGGVVGEVSLDLPNLLGSLRHVRVHWRRLGPATQTMDLFYAEPRLPLLPLGAQVAFQQDLRDTLYIQRAASVQLTSMPGQSWNVAGGVGINELRVLPPGAGQGLKPYRHRRVNLAFHRQATDHVANPTRGYRIRLSLEGGTLAGADLHPQAALARGELDAGWVTSRGPLTLAVQLRSMALASTQYTPQSPEYGRFGGSGSLRGYREDQFLAPWGVTARNELRYRTGADTRIHLFADVGLLPGRDGLGGAGVGALLRLGQNLLQLDLAWNGSDNFQSGKVHVRLINIISGN